MSNEPTMAFRDRWQTGLLDHEGYLRRVGLVAQPPSREALAELLRAHRLTFTFDNIDVLLRQHPGVSLEAIQEKFIGRGRGGYCFEHATLFAAVLDRSGYDVSVQLGRVGNRQRASRTHMVVFVDLDGEPLMTDPGFGFTFPEPLPLVDGVEQEQAGARYRLARADDGPCPAWALSRLRADGWQVQHTTDMLPVRPVDVEMGHLFTNDRPETHFRRRLIISLLHADGSHTSVTHEAITVRSPGEETTSRKFTMADLPHVLDDLKVHLTPDERQRLTERVRALVTA